MTHKKTKFFKFLISLTELNALAKSVQMTSTRKLFSYML